MNKNEIKATLSAIESDAYLKTKVKAKMLSNAPQKKSKGRLLALSTAAICCVMLAVAVIAGIGITKAPDYIAEGNITVMQASPESETATANTVDTTNGAALSNPAWINNKEESFDNSDITFVVNGKELSKDHYVKFSEKSEYADISLSAIIEALGGKIFWANSENADVFLNGKHYIMGAVYGDFVEIKTDKNLFADKDGAVHSNPQKINGEFIMDNRSIENLMENLGYKMEIDFENKTITIS